MKSVASVGTSPVLMVVSHSHWDREWHMPFQQFRIKLGKMIDSLLNILASSPDFSCFMLDGQTVLLEDYAELRPERVEELRAHIRAGRIQVGPWYVLPDEFLVSGESLIRNLQEGRDVAGSFGGYMKVGYLPDQFGHIAQMPQILSGFGIGSAVLWRGVDDDLIEGTEFTWRGLDGTGVLAVNIPDGYFNAGGLPEDQEELDRRIRSISSRLAPKANTQFLRLMNGGDHVWPQPKLPEILSNIKGRMRDVEVRHASLPQFLEAVQRVLAEKGVLTEVVDGELRRCKNSHLLPGVLSTRGWIKRRNAACENLLEKWAEPFTAWAWVESTARSKGNSNGAGCPVDDTSLSAGENWKMPLRLAWKYLLQNQPHDSVCGCSVDQVHEEMKTRYDWAEQIGETLVEESFEEITRRIDTAQLPAKNAPRNGFAGSPSDGLDRLVVFNPLARARTDLVTFEAAADDGVLSVVDDQGAESPCQVLEDSGNGKLKLGFIATGVPGLGYQTFRIHRRKGDVGADVPVHPGVELGTGFPEAAHSTTRIENEFFVVTVNEIDGTINVLERSTDQLYTGLNRFADVGDAGDEYNLDPPLGDRPLLGLTWPPRVTLVDNGPVRFRLRIRSALRLPRELTADRRSRSNECVDCPVTTTVSLYPMVNRIDFFTEVENLAKDHCLRVLFPTGVKTNHFSTETQFGVLRRDLPVVGHRPDWVEDPVATQPQKSFVDVNDWLRGLLLSNRGLPECEVTPQADGLLIALTLLRSVGWLSRGDLRSRRGDAGPELPTPGAQCLGTHRFDYALVPHTGEWIDASFQAHQHNAPLRSALAGAHPGRLPARLSFIALAPDWVPVSAVKPSHDGKAVIVRLYNPTSESADVTVRSYRPLARAELVDLKEDCLQEMALTEEALRVPIPAQGVATVKLYYW
ncbi:MAG: glycosyl hydrolase-related protein [Chloroflexi bacterium]|nr:glycosyl hydrolase-related protein [Chloroflexota bacterium]